MLSKPGADMSKKTFQIVNSMSYFNARVMNIAFVVPLVSVSVGWFGHGGSP